MTETITRFPRLIYDGMIGGRRGAVSNGMMDGWARSRIEQ